ncbi:hypothetical protein ACP3TG_08250 [Phytobacter diazotrophicus]
MKKVLMASAIIFSVVGCAGQAPLKKQTASGKPEAVYKNTQKSQVKDWITELCSSTGFMISESTDNTITCGKQQEGGQAILSQALIGNAYSTTPVSKTRFTLAQINSDTKVWADMWVETQMAFGQMQQVPITNNNVRNQVQDALDQLALLSASQK